MFELLFIGALTLGYGIVFYWAFRFLPRERWQIFASIPWRKKSADTWSGLNLTYYGVLVASAQVFALGLFLVLMSATGVPILASTTLGFAIVLICAPASWLLARLIERKRFTFTIGGASLCGLVIAPFLIILLNLGIGESMGFELLLFPSLSALVIAYATGEGLGRLACISFGCCYGKPIETSSQLLKRVFGRMAFTFHGHTKKIAYEGGLEGVRVIPIQGVTASVFVAVSLVGLSLFLLGEYRASFVVTISSVQFWRFVSELIRVDFRGGGKISSYQWMSLAAIFYAVILTLFAPASSQVPVDLPAGVALLWDPGVILFLQCAWLGMFLALGLSMVTEASLSFYVRRDRV